MKKLIFIRHGRAEDPASEISDFERSLTIKGKSISKLMAHEMKKTESSLGTIITSPAFRAIETAYIFGEEYGVEPESIIVDSNLYHKMSLHYLLDLLLSSYDSEEKISLFGHNPAFSEIPDSLCKQGTDFMPKSGVICISFDTNKWSDIKHNSGKIEYFLKPEKLL
jgi:phosphohistidine phosphatase